MLKRSIRCVLSTLCLANFPLTALAAAPIEYDATTHTLQFGEAILKPGLDMACGMVNDQALYASFGLEEQIYKCHKIVLPMALSYRQWFGNLALAPLYDSIMRTFPAPSNITYGHDSEGRAIDGNNPYFDWYKNLGSRTYLVDKYPLLEAYVGYRINDNHSLRAGRFKNAVGLEDHELPWDDNAKFAPMAHWLSRDLLSGIEYQFDHQYAELKLKLLSGNNPMKGYAHYLNGVQNANTKGNNTPSLGFNAAFKLGELLPVAANSKLYVGGLRDEESSTYFPGLDDGKRRNSTYVAGVLLDKYFANWRVSLYGQYTVYLSGLDESSAQNDHVNPIFYNIEQKGFYVGTTLRYQDFSIAYAFEEFDRFDSNVFEQSGYSKDGYLLRLKQQSHIVSAAYAFNRSVSVALGYHHLTNPVKWVSDILDTRSTYRIHATLHVQI